MRTMLPSLALAFSLLAVVPVVAQSQGPSTCAGGNQPAATLLIPYFEVDLADPDGPRTILSVNNADDTSVVARVVLWTDWGLPTFAFDVFLGPDDMQTVDLWRLFTQGWLPSNVLPDGPVDGVADCSDELLNPGLDDETLNDLRAKHTGRPSPADGLCHGSPREAPDLAVGYLTVDALNGCSKTIHFPTDDGYFVDGGTGLASNRNVLWGDVLYLSSGDDAAQGIETVPVPADAELVADLEDVSFYRSYLGEVRDNRLPLGSHFRSRFVNGGDSGMNSEVIVWTEGLGAEASPRACDEPFPAYPSVQVDLLATFRDEQGKFAGSLVHQLYERTLKLAIGQDPLIAEKSFGQIELATGIECNVCGAPITFTPGQTWMTAILRADKRFSVAQHATNVEGRCPR